MRLFVAVDIDAAARTAIARLQRRLKARAALRWVNPEHLHLTLVFLGDVDDRTVPAAIESYARPIDTRPFDMTLQGLGIFPPRGAPRALWVGVGAGRDELIAVQRGLADRAHALRLAIDARPFSPHLTLARWRERRSADRLHLLEEAGDSPIAAMRITRATLYRSQLSSAGPTYSALAHATLTAR